MKLRLLFSTIAMITVTGLQAQIESVGIIGPAATGGWDFDTNMVQDMDSSHLWTLTMMLEAGDCKFRANDDWPINWGDNVFPLGTGIQDGENIPVTYAGVHDISFNSNTGEYYFSVQSDIGVIGSASLFDWNEDVNMYQDATDTNMYVLRLDLKAGDIKFRQDDDWAVNWGAADFPSGTGVQGGPNIPVDMAGEYIITFNKASGEYHFQLVGFSSIAVTGDATPGGWGSLTAMNSTGADEWSLSLNLVDGGVQFVADSGVAVWGGVDFPTGVATGPDDTISVTGGLYEITFNTETRVYDFAAVTIYETIGIIGDATPGGWGEDTDLNRSDTDSSVWTLRIELTDGFAKFRADNDWIVNWGAGTFPSGTGVQDGADIPVTAGEYNITFNSFTGDYNFQEIFVYDTMGLIGNASPFLNWDDDVIMDRDPADENKWIIPEIILIDAPDGGGVKFRADRAWAVNWGAVDFPNGVGTQDGPNILCTAGTYGVRFNDATGEYMFGDPITSSTRDLLDPASIGVYPNPAKDLLNIDLSAIEMRGDVTIRVYDINGKLVQMETQQGEPQMTISTGGLQTGFYSLHISNDRYIIGKKFTVVK